MAEKFGPCNNTGDCVRDFPDVSVYCYVDPAWNNETNFCDCSNYYGWIGESCDQVSGMLIYARFAFLVQLIWPILLLVPTMRTTFFHIRYVRHTGKKFTSIFYTGLLVAFQCSLWIIYATPNVKGVFDSSSFELAIDHDILAGGEIKEAAGVVKGRLARTALAANTILVTVIAVQITSTWVQVIEKMHNFFPEIVSARFTRIVIVCLLFLTAFVIVPLAALDYTGVMSLMIAINSLLMIGLVSWCAWRLESVLKSFSTGDMAKGTLFLVRRSSRVHILGLVLIILFSVFYAISFGSTVDDVQPGGFNVTPFASDLGVLVALALLSFDSWYCHVLSRKLLSLSNSDADWVPTILRKKSSANDMSSGLDLSPTTILRKKSNGSANDLSSGVDLTRLRKKSSANDLSSGVDVTRLRKKSSANDMDLSTVTPVLSSHEII